MITIGEDADGRIDLARLEAALERDRRPAAPDRVVLGGLERHRDPVRHPGDLGPAPPPRRAVVLGLRGRRAVRRDRDGSAPAGPAGREPDGDAALDYKDAIVVSPHKFIGGPGTPGVLVARRELFRNRVPTSPGGGTVAYVNPLEHVYLDDPEHREEGGTPAIIESIRAGLVFQLKERVGVERDPRGCEEDFIDRAIAAWSAEPGIGILGNPALPRLSIVSFTIRHDGRYLHHNFVVALLNDLFGIQSRGGCSCAGPYGHRLLGIDIETSHAFEREISRGCEGIKPGWVRVNFNYFISEAVFDYLVGAVALVARDGWRLLPWYRFEPATGHVAPRAPARPSRRCRCTTSLRRDGLRYPAHRHREPASRRSRATWRRRTGSWPTRSAVLGPPPEPPGRRRRRRTSSRSAGSGSRTSSGASPRLSSAGRAGGRGRRWPCPRRPSPPSCRPVPGPIRPGRRGR